MTPIPKVDTVIVPGVPKKESHKGRIYNFSKCSSGSGISSDSGRWVEPLREGNKKRKKRER